MIKIGIVDDNIINRRTIKEKLEPYPEISIVVEALNGEDFFQQLAAKKATDFPQIVLMDLEMPVLDGISTISISSVKYPDIKFIVLTIYEDNDKIFEAIKAGASGYLLKEDNAVNIMEAINSVIDFNGIPMSPAIARRAMNLLKEIPKPPKQPTSNLEENTLLSDREMEILKEIVLGKTPQQIGDTLFISPNTVRTHVNNIYKKLHINSRSQAVSLAYKNNWI